MRIFAIALAVVVSAAAANAQGTPLCFGDGSASSCPCGNDSQVGAGQGCMNSTGAGGTLSGSGSNSLFLDNLVFTATGVIPNDWGILFQGNDSLNGGQGLLFGDGLRCCGGNVLQLPWISPTLANPSGEAVITGIPQANDDSPFHSLSAGDSRCYQYWYRDQVGSPCGSGFNFTNAYVVVWMS